MSDVFDLGKGRSTSRVTHAPWGASQMGELTKWGSFGTDAPAAAAPAAASICAAPVTEPVPAEPTAAPVNDGASTSEAPEALLGLEMLKMKAIALVTKINKDLPDARAALADLLKKLEVSKAIPKTTEVDADETLNRLRSGLKLRGSHGVIGLGRRFRSMDDSGDKKLSLEEFRKGLMEMDVAMSESDIHRLFRSFDSDCNGYLSFDEVLVGIRGELNPRRLEMVKLAFKVLDKTGDGQISLADVEGRYDASKHPDVVAGCKDPKEVLLEFMETFESQGGGVAGDGMVSFEEFCKYYGSVSASVDDDDYFELMIRNVWHISGGEGWSENTTCKRVLIVKDDGSQQVVELTDDFDVDTKDMETVKRKLAEQGITFKSVALYGLDVSSLGPPSSPSVAAPPASPRGVDVGRNRNVNMRSSIMFG